LQKGDNIRKSARADFLGIINFKQKKAKSILKVELTDEVIEFNTEIFLQYPNLIVIGYSGDDYMAYDSKASKYNNPIYTLL